jgi:hypothetical protein|nr:MAG TPA: hypothetical protein [Bacteriophage sp.]DAP42416.1 MAG TPA: hypothetical protein [Caudoviricetes sp.]DAZ07075.1 MAG TPA: hypothetical protein [Caudoviricetes sp.]
MTMEEVIAKVEQDSQPEKVLISIPEDKRKRIPDEICKILMGNGLSLQQAEMLLAIAKSRLRKAII